MAVTRENSVGGHDLPTDLHSRLRMEDPFDNYGLDFKPTVRHLIKGHVVFTDQGDSVSQAQHDSESKQNVLTNLLDSPSSACCSGLPKLSEDADISDDAQSHSQLVFLSGYPSPEQVARLTQAHDINLEVWRRHLGSFLTTSASTFEDVKVPSAACNILQLRVWTIGVRGNQTLGNQINVGSLRKDAEVLMERYREKLTTGIPWRTGDSVVRKYEVHSHEYFSIQQLLTIYVSTSSQVTSVNGKPSKWHALVCSDCGRDIRNSPKGPWLGDHLPWNAEYYTRFLPVPEHRSWAASQNHDAARSSQRVKATSALKELPQSLAKLPMTYGDSQNLSVMREDPLYALNSLFSFFVCSEAHVLSFLATQIEANSSPKEKASEVADIASLSNLLHCRQLLEGHVEELEYVFGIVKRRGSSTWPRASSEVAERAASSLQQDLEYLVERAIALQSRSETSINLSMNVASIGEAQRGVQQNKALFRFTIVASVYVPLSFTATLFGMNFRQLGQGELSMWIYFAASVPVFTLSALFLFVNSESIINIIRRARQEK